MSLTLNHGQLFGHCIRVLDTYNRDMQSVEEHVNRYLKNQSVCIYYQQTYINRRYAY